jgi:hypothetical protein
MKISFDICACTAHQFCQDSVSLGSNGKTLLCLLMAWRRALQLTEQW